MSGAYSNKKKVEEEKNKRAQFEKEHEKLLIDKKKTKNIIDDAEARRNRKRQQEEEKKLKEDEHRVAVLAERRRIKDIEKFKKNLKEQRKKAREESGGPFPQPPPEDSISLDDMIKESRSTITTPRVVQAHTVEKLSDQLKELQKKLMFTIPMSEEEVEKEEKEIEKVITSFDSIGTDESTNGLEQVIDDLEMSRHIRWRDFETSQPIHSELATPRSPSFSPSSTASSIPTEEDDVASVNTDDVASFDGIYDFGATQKIRSTPKKPVISSSTSSPSHSPSPSPLSPSTFKKQPSFLKSSSPVPSSNTRPSHPSSSTTSTRIRKPSPAPSPAPPSPSPSTISAPSPSPSLSTLNLNNNNSTPNENDDQNGSHSTKQFQSKIPRLKNSQKLITPASTSTPPPSHSPSPSPSSAPVISTNTPVSPVPIRAKSPELPVKSKQKKKDELNESTQLFVYVEELVRKSGISMDQIMNLANEKSPPTARKTAVTGLSMEEDRLLHALRELEKTGAQQQQAIGKLYKEINEMIVRKAPPPKPAEPAPRKRASSNSKSRPPPPSKPAASQAQEIHQPLFNNNNINSNFNNPPTLNPQFPPQYVAKPMPQQLYDISLNNSNYPPQYVDPATYIQAINNANNPYMQYQNLPIQIPPQYNPPQPAHLYPQPTSNLQLSPNARKQSLSSSSSSLSPSSPSPSSSSPVKPRVASKQSPRPSPRSTAHKLHPSKAPSNSSLLEPSPPSPLMPQATPSIQPPHYVTPITNPPSPPQPTRHDSSPPSSLSPSTSYPRVQSAGTNSRATYDTNYNYNYNNYNNTGLENESGSTPRSTGGYPKKTRPMYAKPVEVLASLPPPTGSPSATPRKAVEPSSFHKWKNAFGNAEPLTSRSQRSYSPISDVGSEVGPRSFSSLENELGPNPRSFSPDAKNDLGPDPNSERNQIGYAENERRERMEGEKERVHQDRVGYNEQILMQRERERGERERENENEFAQQTLDKEEDLESYYDSDRFETYSSDEEVVRPREVERPKMESRAVDRPKGYDTTEGKVVKTELAKLLFG